MTEPNWERVRFIQYAATVVATGATLRGVADLRELTGSMERDTGEQPSTRAPPSQGAEAEDESQ